MSYRDINRVLMALQPGGDSMDPPHPEAFHSPSRMDHSQAFHDDVINQPEPIHSVTHMDLYEALGLGADASAAGEPTSVNREQNEFMENDTDYKGHDHTYELKEKNVPLFPVPPNSSGEGPPYAAADWPNPGDIWGWKVGKRVTAAGFYSDRYITLPRSLQTTVKPKTFISKSQVVEYLRKHFPDADINAFFSSFTWKIPVEKQAINEDASLLPEVNEESKTEKAETEPTEGGISNSNSRKRTPRAAALAATAAAKRQTRESNRRHSPIPSNYPGDEVEILNEEPKASKTKTKPTPKTKTKGAKLTPTSGPKRGGAVRGPRVVEIPHVEEAPPAQVIPEEFFDSYLDSLEDILNQPLSDPSLIPPPAITSPAFENEMSECRRKLSSLLVMDLPSLVSSKHLTEIANLVSKIQKDPSLNVDQIVKLKLVEEIPLISEVFLDTRETIEQADRFFSDLEEKKAKVALLKLEYSEFKGSADQLQGELDMDSSVIQEIDNQIAQLQSQRAKLVRAVNGKKKTKGELKSAQKMVADSIPTVVRDIQVANSVKTEWEHKKENAVKREAEFLVRFAPLRGFCL